MYAVIGHAPRQLDRNVALVGRVLQGIDLLSSLPRGSGEMGFYVPSEPPAPIRSMRIAADVPQAERTPIEVLRTDSATFRAILEQRRNAASRGSNSAPTASISATCRCRCAQSRPRATEASTSLGVPAAESNIGGGLRNYLNL